LVNQVFGLVFVSGFFAHPYPIWCSYNIPQAQIKTYTLAVCLLISLLGNHVFVTEKAVTNYRKSVTNQICDGLCDRTMRSQNPWSENQFVTDSVTNCDDICDWQVGHSLRPHFWPLNIWDLFCDGFCGEKFRLNCDRFCNRTIVVTDFVTKSDQSICDRTCDRYRLWPKLWLT